MTQKRKTHNNQIYHLSSDASTSLEAKPTKRRKALTNTPQSENPSPAVDVDILSSNELDLFLQPYFATKVREAEDELHRSDPGNRQAYCENLRDSWLDKSTELGNFLGCLDLVFQKFASKDRDDDEAWSRFLQLATPKHKIQAILTALTTVKRQWGEEVVKHYGWSSQGGKYCNALRAGAKACPDWRMAATKLNKSMCKRAISVRCQELRDCSNPIEQSDLGFLVHEDNTVSCSLDSLPPNKYGLDKHGLLVREKYAVGPIVTFLCTTPIKLPKDPGKSKHQTPLARISSISLLPASLSTSPESAPTAMALPDTPPHAAPAEEETPESWKLVFGHGRDRALVEPCDVGTLDDGKRLNDGVINFYIQVLLSRSHSNSRTFAFNTWFFSQLKRGGPESVIKWHGDVDLSAKHIIIIPIFEVGHWYLALVCRIPGSCYFIATLDSLGLSHHDIFDSLVLYFQSQQLDLTNAKKLHAVNIPQQTNNFDCGVFLLAFVENLLACPDESSRAICNGWNLGWQVNPSKLRENARAVISSLRTQQKDLSSQDFGSDVSPLILSANEPVGQRISCNNPDTHPTTRLSPRELPSVQALLLESRAPYIQASTSVAYTENTNPVHSRPALPSQITLFLERLSEVFKILPQDEIKILWDLNLEELQSVVRRICQQARAINVPAHPPTSYPASLPLHFEHLPPIESEPSGRLEKASSQIRMLCSPPLEPVTDPLNLDLSINVAPTVSGIAVKHKLIDLYYLAPLLGGLDVSAWLLDRPPLPPVVSLILPVCLHSQLMAVSRDTPSPILSNDSTSPDFSTNFFVLDSQCVQRVLNGGGCSNAIWNLNNNGGIFVTIDVERGRVRDLFSNSQFPVVER